MAHLNKVESEIIVKFLETYTGLVSRKLGGKIKKLKQQNELWDSMAELVNSNGKGNVRTAKEIKISGKP